MIASISIWYNKQTTSACIKQFRCGCSVPSKAQNKEGEKELKGLLEPRNAAFYLHKDLRDTHFNKWRKVRCDSIPPK